MKTYRLYEAFKKLNIKINLLGGDVVTHVINWSTQDAEAGRSLWVETKLGLQELVPGKLGLLKRETLSWEIEKEWMNERKKRKDFSHKIDKRNRKKNSQNGHTNVQITDEKIQQIRVI